MEIERVINRVKNVLLEIGFTLLCFVNRVKADELGTNNTNHTNVNISPDLGRGEEIWKSLPTSQASNDILSLLYYCFFTVVCAVIIVVGFKLLILIYKGDTDLESIKKEFGSRNKIKYTVEAVLMVVGGLVAVNIIFNYSYWGF
jgi:hypothetical protein